MKLKAYESHADELEDGEFSVTFAVFCEEDFCMGSRHESCLNVSRFQGVWEQIHWGYLFDILYVKLHHFW